MYNFVFREIVACKAGVKIGNRGSKVGFAGGVPSSSPIYLPTYSLFIPTTQAWNIGVSDSPVSANKINFLAIFLPNATIDQIVNLYHIHMYLQYKYLTCIICTMLSWLPALPLDAVIFLDYQLFQGICKLTKYVCGVCFVLKCDIPVLKL